MAMNPAAGSAAEEPEPMMDINTTPLIDVMLVLIIMLIITIPVQLHAVNLDLPSGAASPPPAEPRRVTIDVDFDGTLLWNGETLDGRNALRTRLAQAAALPEPPEVHVRPNRLVEYSHVAEVLAESQRLGIAKLGMVGGEAFEP